MLKVAPKPGDPATSHDDLFMARYERLVRAALRLTEGEQAAAEDLVHDAFIQFTLKRPNLAAIASLDGYLFVMLRNLHISQARRASQTPTIKLAISDYDTAEIGLRLIDPQRRFQARDDLRRVCEYAVRRKETSKAASVLILRFFHLYFPGEIAKVLVTTRQAVEIWLLNARRESRLYLEDPTALKLIGKKEAANKVVRLHQHRPVRNSPDIFRELCENIFASRQGDCLTRDQLHDLYESEKAIECERLAHTVSCPNCLEIVNDLLGLSSLNERHKMESADTDTSPPEGGGPPATSGGIGGAGEIGTRLRRRRRETIEHRPRELRIAVNGFFVGRQKVGLPINELALKLNVEEKIRFIEVFSEQGLLLSHFTVTPPTDGELEQREAVEFGEGRTLETAVSFNTQWPTLNIVYRDPLVAHLQNVVVEADADPLNAQLDSHDGENEAAESGLDSLTSDPPRKPSELGRDSGLLGLSQRLRRISRAQFWLRPGAITAVFALLLLAALFIVVRRNQPVAPVTAAAVLQRAASAEQLAAANSSTATHRTLQVEERRGSLDGELLASRRVELWQSAARGVMARRLYDERGRLLAGEWTRSDNVTTRYQHGARPQLRPPGQAQSSVTLENVWLLSPSATDFTSLVGQAQDVKLEERGDHYILSSENAGAVGRKLVQARLVLSRDDLHAVEQTLLVQQANETRAYRIVETSFERRPNDAVAPAMFEPEPELLSSAEPETRNFKLETGAPPSGPQPLTPVLATAALEVEVLQLLNQANAFMGEQVSVTRTSEGRLLISGMVETEDRKSELLRTLASVRSNPAVRIEIETVAQAAQRERPKSPSNIAVERVEATEGTSPAYAELKKRFSDDEGRRYADRMMTRSRQARRHALALKQLAERFSLNDLRALPESDRARWIGLLQEHARECQREVRGLRRELQQVFPALSEAGAVSTGLNGDAEIQDAARRLYEFSVAVDEDVRQSFALSSQAAAVAQVKADRFWQSLRNAEALAAKIGKQ
jgi:RNA polymerase sigma factor (sigma-70 family)